MIYLELRRYKCTKDCIRGALFLVVNDVPSKLCETLEPAPNCLLFAGTVGFKAYPAVENGIYNLSVTYSPKFRCNLPLLSVPGRSGIRIHAGNNSSDTSGCILVGVIGTVSSLSHSRIALKYVIDVIKAIGVTSIKVVSDSKLF